MQSITKKLVSKLQNYLQFDSNDLKKLFLMAFGYFFIIASYSILRPIKTSLFLGLVGKEYQPWTRFITPFMMFPVMLGYSKLVDKVKRHQIVYTIIGLAALLSIIFALLLAHPVLGVKNTFTSPYRILGWGFEIFMDLYSAIVIATFWGFINTSCTPTFANKSYGFIAATGKLGGVISPLLGLYISNWTHLETSKSIPLLIFIAGAFLLITLLLIRIITRKIPKEYLMGYQATHEVESNDKKKKSKPGIFEGLKLMLTQPYVMGIFILLFSIEVIAIIFDYQMQVIMSVESNNHIGIMTNAMFLFTFCFQSLGFFFAIAGTSPLLRIIGIRSCLLLVPLTLIALTAALLIVPTFTTIFVIMVIIKALNYGFNFPIREMLYIPTTKNIQFKSKAWIESFGKTFSKATGSGISLITISDNLYKLLSLNAMWSFLICFFYLITSFFVGRKYVETIKKNELIG